MWVRYAASAASTVLLSAYVAYVVVDARDTVLAWSFLLSALTLAAAPVVLVLSPFRARELWRTTAVLQHVAGLVVACACRDLSAYGVAFTFGFVFTTVLVLAHGRGFLNYHADVGFCVSSAATYAVLRVTSRLLVRETRVGHWAAYLVPFAASSTETLGMYLSGENSYYTYTSGSYLFVAYSLLKAALFLALPRVETLLIAHYGG